MTLSFTGNNNRMDGYFYDAAGNLLNDGTHNYYFDAESRIIQVDGGTLGACSTATACYVYSASGQRVRKTTSGTSVDYIRDLAGHEITELSSTGAMNRGEVYAGGRHVATYELGTTYLNFSDWLGTERLRTLATGVTCETITSLPFGDGQNTSGSCADSSPMHFTGKDRDAESGLDNFGARYNSSTFGRFISPDPAGLKAVSLKNPQTWDLYAYTLNNPLRFTDPTGMYTCADDQNKCKSEKDQAFEAARQLALQSGDKKRIAAANAYGDPTKDNHVAVGFVSGDKGSAPFSFSWNGKTVSYQITVNIPGSHVGIALDEDIAHEGTHVVQEQAFAASLTPNGKFDPTLNLTSYASEFDAFHANASIIQDSGQPRSLDPQGNYFIKPGDSPKQIDGTINQFLADPASGYAGVTPQNPGTRIVESKKGGS